jgi:hypothetical protein
MPTVPGVAVHKTRLTSVKRYGITQLQVFDPALAVSQH